MKYHVLTIFDIREHHMMLGYVKNRQPVLFHSHPGQGGGGGGGGGETLPLFVHMSHE